MNKPRSKGVVDLRVEIHPLLDKALDRHKDRLERTRRETVERALRKYFKEMDGIDPLEAAKTIQ